jgi:hypothetical protein
LKRIGEAASKTVKTAGFLDAQGAPRRKAFETAKACNNPVQLTAACTFLGGIVTRSAINQTHCDVK